MALRFIDGFDHYATADLLKKWSSVFGSVVISAALPRTGTQSLYFVGGNRYLTKSFDDQQTWIIGFAIRLNSSGTNTVLSIFDAGTVQIDMDIAGGVVDVRRGASTVLGTSPPGTFNLLTWHYIELKVLISNTVGTVDVTVDGTNVISLTNQDTQASANATANSFRIGIQNGGDAYYDDLYVCDGTGAENNDLLGVVKIDTLYPDGNGNSSQFVGQDANSVDNYLNVDEAIFDGDTTYNESATVTERDDYTFDAMNITPVEIFGVVLNTQAKKTDAGTRSLDVYTRVSAVNYDAAIDQTLAENYVNYQAIWDLNPADSLAWEVADVDGAGFGIEVAS